MLLKQLYLLELLVTAEVMEDEGRHSERDALGFGKPDTTEQSDVEHGYSF